MAFRMTDCDILYFIEHPARELDIATAIKYICEKEFGLRVAIKSLPLEFKDAAHKYRPKVTAFPFLYSSDIDFYFQGGYYINHWKNVTYFNLNFEQYFTRANRIFKAPKDDFVKSRVYQHAWNNSFKDYLVEYGVEPSHIFVNGNPNFMLYREPYRKLYSDKNELAHKHQLDPTKTWVLLAENYGWAFLSDREIKAKINQGFGEKAAHLNREINRQNVSAVLTWLRDLCENKTHIEVILRPRPAISIGEWKRIVEREIQSMPPGLHIIKDGTIKEWALCCDIVLSSISTCLMDAVVADKPAYVLEPIDYPREFVTEWFDDIDHLKRYEELASAVENPKFNQRHEAFRESIFRRNLANGDPIRGLAVYLVNLVREHRGKPEFVSSPFDSIKDLYRKATMIKGAVSGIVKGELNSQRHESDQIRGRDVRERLSRWGDILT